MDTLDLVFFGITTFCGVFLVIYNFYSTIFTVLVFHTSLEVFVGLLVGLIYTGLYLYCGVFYAHRARRLIEQMNIEHLQIIRRLLA